MHRSSFVGLLLGAWQRGRDVLHIQHPKVLPLGLLYHNSILLLPFVQVPSFLYPINTPTYINGIPSSFSI